ncbi:MAG: hypothetical protein R2698_02705 [Microthrixaceae bacterium]
MSTDTPTTPTVPRSPFAGNLPLLEITDAARETVMSIRAEEPDATSLGLRIEITGSQGREYTYDLCFDELSGARPDDELVPLDDLTVIVPAATVDRLRGSVLDVSRATQGGLVIRNPNRADPMAGVELNRDGTVAEQVEQLLDEVINPSLAMHGGLPRSSAWMRRTRCTSRWAGVVRDARRAR